MRQSSRNNLFKLLKCADPSIDPLTGKRELADAEDEFIHGRGERPHTRSCYVSPQVDVGHQSQRIDIVLDVSVDVVDRYSPATSSYATTAILQCMVHHSLCFVKRQAAKNWTFLSRLFELS
jgi:hypothetical protein